MRTWYEVICPVFVSTMQSPMVTAAAPPKALRS
jgi:hypothetical protein